MSIKEHVIETDVAIMGGSLAGGFAAIRAKEVNPNLDVLIVDKAFASKGGGGALMGGWQSTFFADRGQSFDAWKKYALNVGEYINNQDWLDIQIKESHDRFEDLASWGAEYNKEPNGEVKLWKYGPAITNVRWASRKFLPRIRIKAESLGVKFLDFVYVTELLQDGGRCSGFLGFSTDTGDLYIVRAKATIIASGASGFKTPGFLGDFRASDGESMAYRAGVELVSKEFGGKEGTAPRQYPNMFVTTGTIVAKHYVNALGENFMPKYLPKTGTAKGWQSEVQTRSSWNFEIAAGRGPVYWNLDAVTPEERELLNIHRGLVPRMPIAQKYGVNVETGKLDILGGCTPGESNRGKGGLLINTKCETSLPGLYAAGDAGGSMCGGSTYVSAGWAFSHACVTGHRAGEYASIYAAKSNKPKINREEVSKLQEVIYTPLNRKSGFGSDWVLQMVQNLMTPYYVLQVKKADRLEAALTFCMFMKNNLVPMMRTADPHGLRMANEVRNMVDCAEANLRTALFRTESRGGHYREDYPRRDDPNWLAWIVVKPEDGEMKLRKKPLPKKWWPDLTIPYRQRYEYIFPGEEV